MENSTELEWDLALELSPRATIIYNADFMPSTDPTVRPPRDPTFGDVKVILSQDFVQRCGILHRFIDIHTYLRWIPLSDLKESYAYEDRSRPPSR